MKLNPITQDHFDSPRNVGVLSDATHRARGTNPICGDFMTLSLRIDGGRIAEARFQAEGCAPTHAAGSALTEKLTGTEAVWARSLESSDVIGWLGGVPPGKEHAAHLAIGVLRDALGSAV